MVAGMKKDGMKKSGTEHIRWLAHSHDWQRVDGEIIKELSITIYVNGIEFITVMGTPLHQDRLAVGFLLNEGILSNLEQVENLRVTPSGCCVDVWMDRTVPLPDKIIITTGCGGGITFDDPGIGIEPFHDQPRVTPEQLQQAFKDLQNKDSLYARARGVHAAGLFDPGQDQLLLVEEDLGRHNTIDKIRGGCAFLGIPSAGNVLLSTGRISSEMLRKAAVMGCPVVASRTSPTSLAVEFARAWGITLVGYVRHGKLRVYSAPFRLGAGEQVEEEQEMADFLSGDAPDPEQGL